MKAARTLFLLMAIVDGAAGQFAGDREPVGRHGDNRSITPVNQVITPYGIQIELPGLRPQAIALSPDGRLLVTSGKTSEMVVLDAASGRVRQRVALPAEQTNRAPQV